VRGGDELLGSRWQRSEEGAAAVEIEFAEDVVE
jgi:hypothetical protein